MKIFNFGHAISKTLDRENSARELHKEAETFDLAGTGGFLAFVKYAVFTVLASLNFHLFYTHVPGIWGVALGLTAILFEACAVYFWNKQNKSAGNHKRALQTFAVLFTTVSFVHGCAALYQLGNVGPSLAAPILIYSKYIAFPLLFGLMVLSVCVTHYLHWSTAISEVRANAQLQAEQGRAELITQSLALANQGEIEKARLKFFEDQILLEEQYVHGVEKFAAIKARGERALQSITDPEVKRELFAALGRITSGHEGPRRINPLPASAQGDTDPKS